MKKTKILLAEDDPNLGLLLNQFLRAKGFETTLCNDGDKAYKEFVKNEYDCVVLDVMMPVKDGFTTAQEIRGINKEIPILFLTAKSMPQDKLKGFEIGADDYLTKPFNMEELQARINAVLKRYIKKEETTSFTLGNYTFDYNTRILSINNEEVKLTTKESDLLKILCQNLSNEVAREDLLKAVWGDDNYFNGRSMDVYVTKLRKYLKKDEKVTIINIHGKGFKLLIQ